MAMKLLLAMALLLGACADQEARAVTGKSCFERPNQAACARETWPNDYSRANSDGWLDTHADALRVMHPRVLVLDFHNPLSVEEVRKVADRQVDALADGSRYHGYADPDAPPFLQYQIERVVDLRDPAPPASWPNTSSSKVPLSGGSFDVPALFAQPYTTWIAMEDPEQPGRMLDLCEQFERGFIHELWLAVGDNAPGREPLSMIECKAARDDAGLRKAGPAQATIGSSICAKLPPCDVTVRIAHLSPLRGVGCDLFVRGWAIQGSIDVIPYLKRNATRFFNADLDTRYGAPKPDLLSLCGYGQRGCFSYPTATSLQYLGDRAKAFRIDDYGAGCGSVEFPPNATSQADWQNNTKVEARCEHYGLRDGIGGDDKASLYSAETLAPLNDRYPDCGGGWQIYWRQNMPGLDNRAFAEDGTAMKNWWPFLFF